MHLQIAERIKSHAGLSRFARVLLLDHYPAFYLGNVAPDFQSVCDIPREDTHFYDLPPAPDSLAYPTMFAQYPELADAGSMPSDQVVFIAAYCAHLLMDLRWFRDVLMPFFVETQEWDSHHQRFLVHNTLLTYLDKLAVESLPGTAANTLAAAVPDSWLPFADDRDLMSWRDLLVRQLEPGALLETITIYAERLDMSPSEFAANLEEPDWMEDHLFRKVPVDEVQQMLTSALDDSVDFINQYLNGVHRN